MIGQLGLGESGWVYSQKQDADEKGHTERAHIINQLIQKVENSQK